jgi:hypothetical protein
VYVDAEAEGFLAVFVAVNDCEVAITSSPAGTDATELERELLLLPAGFPLVEPDEIMLVVFTREPRDEFLDELLLLEKYFSL